MQTYSKKLHKIKHNDNDYIDFIYDDLKRLSEIKIHFGDTFSLEKYSYNDQNQMIKREYGKNYEDIYSYENGLLKSSESINKINDRWHRKNVFIYDNNRITKANVYFNEILTGYILYKYDLNGNTIERKEYSYGKTEPDVPVSHYKFYYDDKKNPVFSLNVFPVDLVQKNNPVYTYYYLVTMSMFPPEYESEFTYDNDGFPVQELRHFKNWPSDAQPEKYTYIYE